MGGVASMFSKPKIPKVEKVAPPTGPDYTKIADTERQQRVAAAGATTPETTTFAGSTAGDSPVERKQLLGQ